MPKPKSGDLILPPTTERALEIQGFELTATSLMPVGNPSYEEWVKCGKQLGRIAGAHQWWIGDWHAYGQGKDHEWGDKYSQFADLTGLDERTIKNITSITRKLDLSLRRDNLSFTVHSVVATDDLSRDEKYALLDVAEREEQDYDTFRKTVKEYKRKRRVEHLPTPPEYIGAVELDSIQVSDIHALDLPRASVDMIFTDPPYHDEYLDLYGALAELAAHVLKPGAYLMTYCGKMFLPTIINTLEANGLEYVWTAAVFQPFSKSKISKHNLFENWRPILLFKKPGDSKVREWVQDVVRGTRDKDFHDWQQDEDAPRQYIPAYTFEGDIVLDPFVGGGTTVAVCKELKRHFLGFDQDPDAVKMSIARFNGKHQ